MTRFARLVLMLALAFAQAAATECPMAPAAHQHASAPEHHSAAEHTGGHAHGRHAPAHRHPAPEHGPAACVLVMACGTAAVAGAELSVPRVAIILAPASASPARRYASPHIPIDAPPPRPSSAA